VLAKRVLAHDGFDLVTALAERQDDAAVAGYLAPRDQEPAFGVVLVQEGHVGEHPRIDLFEIRFVVELDDAHRRAA
jgi:hypothetical protein